MKLYFSPIVDKGGVEVEEKFGMFEYESLETVSLERKFLLNGFDNAVCRAFISC